MDGEDCSSLETPYGKLMVLSSTSLSNQGDDSLKGKDKAISHDEPSSSLARGLGTFRLHFRTGNTVRKKHTVMVSEEISPLNKTVQPNHGTLDRKEYNQNEEAFVYEVQEEQFSFNSEGIPLYIALSTCVTTSGPVYLIGL